MAPRRRIEWETERAGGKSLSYGSIPMENVKRIWQRRATDTKSLQTKSASCLFQVRPIRGMVGWLIIIQDPLPYKLNVSMLLTPPSTIVAWLSLAIYCKE